MPRSMTVIPLKVDHGPSSGDGAHPSGFQPARQHALPRGTKGRPLMEVGACLPDREARHWSSARECVRGRTLPTVVVPGTGDDAVGTEWFQSPLQ